MRVMDPEVLFQDLETAQNAIQVALTCHFVLSTLHTNDAPTATTRLLDLGMPSFFGPFLILLVIEKFRNARLT